MRKIKITEGLTLAISHAGLDGEALTNVQLNIPIDGNKYIQGVNLIECIKDRLLPLLNVAAISQQFSATDIDLLEGLGEIGTFRFPLSPNLNKPFPASYLIDIDDASLGTVEFIEGESKARYTP